MTLPSFSCDRTCIVEDVITGSIQPRLQVALRHLVVLDDPDRSAVAEGVAVDGLCVGSAHTMITQGASGVAHSAKPGRWSRRGRRATSRVPRALPPCQRACPTRCQRRQSPVHESASRRGVVLSETHLCQVDTADEVSRGDERGAVIFESSNDGFDEVGSEAVRSQDLQTVAGLGQYTPFLI